jgi:hypothetical protein
MNAQEAQTLQLHEIVAWTPDEMKGEVIVMDGSGVKVHWDGSQCGYYQFTDLLSQIEKVTLSEAPKAKPQGRAEAGSPWLLMFWLPSVGRGL